MLRATVIGFDGVVQVYSSEQHATCRMGALFDRLANGQGYEVEVGAAGSTGGVFGSAGGTGGVFGSELYEHWTFADEAHERGANKEDQHVTYRLLPSV